MIKTNDNQTTTYNGVNNLLPLILNRYDSN